VKTTFGTVDRLGAVLSHHRERHLVLAGNVANVDTPGFRPQDLVPARPDDPDGMALARTHEAHLGDGGPASGGRIIEDGGFLGADGNAVDLERELAKVDANRVRYAATAELASRKLALLRYGAGDGA
jgi:flagellar basal-body rod protein FlgB